MFRERLTMLLGGLLGALSWLFIAVGVLAFFCADRALVEFAYMSWGLAELLGTGGAVVCLIVGIGLKSLRDS